MAPGVFLTQRRPSSSSQNNASAKGTRKRLGCGAGVGKGEGPWNPSLPQGLHCSVWCGHAQVQACGCKSDLVTDRACGLDCPGTAGPSRCFSAGLVVAGCEVSLAGALPNPAPAREEHPQGHIPDSLAGGALARGGCIHEGCSAQGWGRHCGVGGGCMPALC